MATKKTTNTEVEDTPPAIIDNTSTESDPGTSPNVPETPQDPGNQYPAPKPVIEPQPMVKVRVKTTGTEYADFKHLRGTPLTMPLDKAQIYETLGKVEIVVA